jgi:hypothetical protein
MDLFKCWNRRVNQSDNIFVWNAIPSYSCAYGEKGTLEASMIKRGRGRIYGLVFSKPYLSGSLLPPYLVSLAMQIFFLFFLVLDLLGVFSCILHVYLGSAYCAALLMNFLYLPKT